MSERTWTRITLEVDVAHDGDAEAVAEHLAVELEAIIRRAPRITVMDGPSTRAEVVRPGDELSAALPAWP